FDEYADDCRSIGDCTLRLEFQPNCFLYWHCDLPPGIVCDGYMGGCWLPSISGWHHLAFAGSAADRTTYLYVDGQPSTVSVASCPLADSTLPVAIGRLASCVGRDCNPFFGSLAEVRIWSRFRTSDEVASDMTITLSGSEPDLIAYWPFSE